MRQAVVKFTGVTPYSASKMIDSEEHPRLEKESVGDWDMRLWRRKATTNSDGVICIPAMGLKMAVDEAVKRLNLQIPGRGKSTYSKFFVAGQICDEDVPIGIHIDDVQSITIWANADGVRGSGKRVKRKFPYVQRWSGSARFSILDDVIPNQIFEKAVIEAGRLVGVGRARPEKGGMLGRFKVDGVTWSTI